MGGKRRVKRRKRKERKQDLHQLESTTQSHFLALNPLVELRRSWTHLFVGILYESIPPRFPLQRPRLVKQVVHLGDLAALAEYLDEGVSCRSRVDKGWVGEVLAEDT